MVMLLVVTYDLHKCGSFPLDIPSAHVTITMGGIRPMVYGFLIKHTFKNDALWYPVES